jgi:hypothetical protein
MGVALVHESSTTRETVFDVQERVVGQVKVVEVEK